MSNADDMDRRMEEFQRRQMSGTVGSAEAENPAAVSTNIEADKNSLYRAVNAERLGTDQKNGGIIGVRSDVQHCYAALAGGPDLKRCVALDMAAKYVDDAMSRQFHISGEPYFSNAAWVSRMRRYAPPALGSKKAAMGFMDTYHAQMMNNSLRYR